MRRMFRQLIVAVVVWTAPFFAQEPASQSPDPPSVPENATEFYRITGRVVDDLTGKPLRGATVQLQVVYLFSTGGGDVSPPKPERTHEFITGKDGRFTFDGVPARNVSIKATKPGYMDVWFFRRRADDPMGSYVISDNTGPIDLRLAPSASISGMFRDHKGSPIARSTNLTDEIVDMTLWSVSDWAGWTQLKPGGYAEYDPDGTYHFNDLQPGRYFLVADPPPNRAKGDRNAEGQRVGETTQRYPKSDAQNPNAFFTLREGEHARFDFLFSQTPLHRVSGTVAASQSYSYNIIDANGSIAYFFNAAPFEKQFESWLPNGHYHLTAGQDGNLTGPEIFEVADSDVTNLSFSTTPAGRSEIPIEITSVASRGPLCFDGDVVCGFWGANFIRLLPSGNIDYIEKSTETNITRGTPPHRVESVSLIPGTYAVVLPVTQNVYVKSMMRGTKDLALEPLVIQPGDALDPIKIVLDEGALVEGTTRRDGKPMRAWVYAVAESIEPTTDFREFQPVISDEDGRFHIEGLAPGSYCIFASEVELPLILHGLNDMEYWQDHGQIVHVKPGKKTELDLAVGVSPRLP